MDSLRETSLGGGRVNKTILQEENGLKSVIQQSKDLGANAKEIQNEVDLGHEAGVDTIQINPRKYITARVFTKFLIANRIPIVWISDAENLGNQGVVEMDYIEGVVGEKMENENAVYQVMAQVIASMHNLDLTYLRVNLPDVGNIDAWLVNRIEYLRGRLKRWNVPGIDWLENYDIMKSIEFLLDEIDGSEQIPFAVVHDDMAPRSLIFEGGDINKPVIIDVESLKIGHPFIDGLCRSMYWGPVGERLVLGQEPRYELIKLIMDEYNENSTMFKMKEKDRDLWILLTEVFWLMDIIAIDWMIEENRPEMIEGISRRMANLKIIIEHISNRDIDAATEVALS